MNKNFGLEQILDIILYSLLAVFLTVLQTVLLPRIFVNDIMPDILLGAVCCIGIYRREKYASVFGLFSGLCAEALGSTGLSLLPLFYTLAGYFCGRIGANTRDKRHFAAFIITLPLFCIFRTALTLLNYAVKYRGNVDLGHLIINVLSLELLYTFLLCIPAFLIVKLFELPVTAIRRRGGL